MAKNKLSQLKEVNYFKPPGAYRPIMDLRGMTFGDITVLDIVTASPVKWLCQCSCGNTLVRSTSDVTRRWHGHHNSCGCKKQKFAETKLQSYGGMGNRGHKTHDESKTKLYKVWQAMRQRCQNPRDKGYKYYGAKGVSIYKEWNLYENFRDWSKTHGYKDGLTIDRINPYGDYCPENCRWTTWEIQAHNKRKDWNEKHKTK